MFQKILEGRTFDKKLIQCQILTVGLLKKTIRIIDPAVKMILAGQQFTEKLKAAVDIGGIGQHP